MALHLWFRSIAVLLVGISLPEAVRAAEPPASDALVAGAAVDGLTCRIVIPSVVHQGDFMQVRVALPYQAPAGSRHFRLLNLPADACAWLEFRDAAGGVHVRYPAVSGMPVFPGSCGENLYLDLRTPRAADSMDVPLLSARGEQLAPGAYDVTAVYSNLRYRGNRAAADSADAPTFWWGTLRSAVAHTQIRAAAPRRITFRVFDDIVRYEAQHGDFSWQWRPARGSDHDVTAEIRPGYFVGHRITVLGGADRQFRSGELSGGTDVMEASGGITAPTDTILVRIAIFETSEGTPHLWSPESGDYRELWSREIWSYPSRK